MKCFLIPFMLALAAGAAAQKPDPKTGRVDIGELIAENTPPPLPQTPRIDRPRSDAQEVDLKGKVKSVRYFHDSADRAYPRRMLTREEFYNEQGDLVRSVDYDSVWPIAVTVYGYIDKMRVSRRKAIDYAEGSNLSNQGCVPLTPVIESPLDSDTPKDPRYDARLLYKFDELGRLIEHRYSVNSRELRTTYTYEAPDRRLVQRFDKMREWLRTMEILDANGNLIEEWYYDELFKISFIHIHRYELDARGSWTAQKSFERRIARGKPVLKHIGTTHRTIIYYP